MSDQDITLLKEATKASAEEKRTADAVRDHAQTCKACHGAVLCQTMKSLAFDFVVAKANADDYRAELQDSGEPEPTVEWLENLYKL